MKKSGLRNFAKLTEKHLCQSLFLIKLQILGPCNFIKKETLAQMFSYEFCEISCIFCIFATVKMININIL